MNPIRIRDIAKRMCKAGLFPQRLLFEILSSPIFVYEDQKHKLSDEEWDWCRDNIMNADGRLPTKQPYQVFTLFRPEPPNMQHITNTVYIVIARKQEVAMADGTKRLNELTVFRHDVLDEKECWLTCCLNSDPQARAALACHYRGRSVPVNGRDGEFQELAKGMVNSTLATLTRFAFDTMSHFGVTLKVSPPPTQGKSVEWHLARTHYLLVGRKQAEVCRSHKRGPTDVEITRAAHWRKAHFKKLVADKWKHKKGQVVPVKQAWVGPKNWQGLDGKIYHVVS